MSEFRTKKSLTNIIFNIINQVVTLVLSFIARSIFIQTLGVEYLGMNGLFTDVLSLLSMADLGFGTAMVYSFYKPLAEKNYRRMAALTSFYKRIYNIITITVTILGLLVVPFLRYIVNTDTEIPNLEIYYLFSLASVIVSYICVYRTSIITADQKNYIVTRITIMTNIAKTIIQIMFLSLLHNYIIYLAVGVLFNLLNNLIASRKATLLYPFIEESVMLEKNERVDIFNNIKAVFLYKVASTLLNATDNTIISILFGTAVVGYYSNYLMIQSKIVAMFSIVFTSMTASIGNLIVKEKAEKCYKIFECEQTVSFIICGVVITCFSVLINDFIILWLGTEYIFSFSVICTISLNMYLSCVLQPLWSYREATGLYQKTKWVMVICAVINLILSIVLGKWIGISGVLLASALSRLLTYVWYEPKLLFNKYFNMSSKSFFLKLFKNFILILLLTSIFVLISDLIPVNSWITLIVKTASTAFIALIVVLMVYWSNMGFVLNKLKAK